MAKLTFHKRAPRRWLGNGFGYDPAVWRARDQAGRDVAEVQFFVGCCWQVQDLTTGQVPDTLASFGTRREAFAAARKHFAKGA